jgi:membrane protease subunit HflC
MRRVLLGIMLLAAALTGLVAAGNLDLGPLVITREDEQKLILFLSQERRVTQPGPSLRWPLLETAESYDRRWLYLNTDPDTILTGDGEQLTVDNYAIWRIRDPIAFKRTFPAGMTAAQKGVDRAVRDGVREVIGRHTLEEVLDLQRAAIMREITERTRVKVDAFGIEVADVRINRTELPAGTEESVYARMATERERLGRKNRAEGDERARRIRAEADRDSTIIAANARRDAEIARGEGDAEAARIYAEAFASDSDFYVFHRSLEAYRNSIDENTTLVLSPDAEFFRFFESARPDGGGGGR